MAEKERGQSHTDAIKLIQAELAKGSTFEEIAKRLQVKNAMDEVLSGAALKKWYELTMDKKF
jgi:hypothetical protein